MNKIHKLAEQEIIKIAAGEVLERPANAVKELIENSIDAGATFISVELMQAGKERIKITDNGSGMSLDDARICFLPHTTSKLSTVQDLETICTFGFRGEALASMCAASLVTIITKEADTLHGTQLTIEQGKILSEEIVSAPQGTTIIVDNIFKHIPARKKFLKKEETEWRSTISMFHAFCLAYPAIHFKIFHNGSLAYNCTPVASIQQRIEQIWNGAHNEALTPLVKQEKNNVSVSGVISLHTSYRYDRSHIYCFVNGRYVKNIALIKAVLKGYQGLLPAQKFPTAVIFIDVPSENIDVNIHPKKEEILFAHPHEVEKCIQQTITATLNQLPETQPAPVQAKPFTASTATSSLSSTPAPFMPQQFVLDLAPLPTMPQSASLPLKNFVMPALPFLEAEQTQIKISHMEEFSIIGQFFNTYIIVEKDGHLILVDQHAAHERILYEQYKIRTESAASIQLLFPTFITLSTQELDVFEPYLPILFEHGIQAERFNDTTLIIHATLVSLKNENIEHLIKACIATITENSGKEITQILHETLYAQIACATAVKAGDVLTPDSMQHIVETLVHTANHLTCPHGRPTHYAWFADQIKKYFKRDYTSKKVDPEYHIL